MDYSRDHSSLDDAAHLIERLKRNDSSDTYFDGWDDQIALWTNEAFAQIQEAVHLNTSVETVSVATVYEDSYMIEEAEYGATRTAQVLSRFNQLREIVIGRLLDLPSNFDYQGLAANVDVLLRGLARNPNANLKVFTTSWSGGSEAIAEFLDRFRGLEDFSLGYNETYCRLTQDFAHGIAASLPKQQNLKKVVLQCTLDSVSNLELILHPMNACHSLKSLQVVVCDTDSAQVPCFRQLLDATAQVIIADKSPLETVELSFKDMNHHSDRGEVPLVDMSSLVGKIVKSNRIHELELSGYCLLNPGVDVFNKLEADSANYSLKCLKLYSFVLRGQWATLLSRFKNLETLVIGLEFEQPAYRGEEPQVWADLLEKLPFLRTFKYLDYSRQRQRDSSIFAAIARSNEAHPSLRHITLHIGKDDRGEGQVIPELRKLLVECRESFHLALPNSNPENIRNVVQGITEAKNLLRFSFSPRERLHQNEWSEDFNEIIDALRRNKSIQAFDVDNVYAWWGDNGVPPEQSALLVSVLAENTTLKHCDLASNCQCKEDKATIEFLLQLNRFGRYLFDLPSVPLVLWPLVLSRISCCNDSEARPLDALFFFFKGASSSIFD